MGGCKWQISTSHLPVNILPRSCCLLFYYVYTDIHVIHVYVQKQTHITTTTNPFRASWEHLALSLHIGLLALPPSPSSPQHFKVSNYWPQTQDPTALFLQRARIIGMHHHPWLGYLLYLFKNILILSWQRQGPTPTAYSKRQEPIDWEWSSFLRDCWLGTLEPF